MTKTFKTFLATYRPVGGLIRVVLVRQDDGWVAYFCTDPEATVAEVLLAVADTRRRWNRTITTSRRFMGRASSSCGTTGRTWRRSTRTWWRAREELWGVAARGGSAVRGSEGTARGTTRSDGLRTPTCCNALKREGLRQEFRARGPPGVR